MADKMPDANDQRITREQLPNGSVLVETNAHAQGPNSTITVSVNDPLDYGKPHTVNVNMLGLNASNVNMSMLRSGASVINGNFGIAVDNSKDPNTIDLVRKTSTISGSHDSDHIEADGVYGFTEIPTTYYKGKTIEFGDDDRVFGDAGDDYISGGAGNDTLEGGSGADRIYGGSDDDMIIAHGNHTAGGDTTSPDILDGGTGNDVLFGWVNGAEMKGGAGNDELISQGGHNVMDGGAGDDYIFGRIGSTNNVIMSQGNDDIHLNGAVGDNFTMQNLTPDGFTNGRVELEAVPNSNKIHATWKGTDAQGNTQILGDHWVDNANKLIAKLSDNKTEVSLTPQEVAMQPNSKVVINDIER